MAKKVLDDNGLDYFWQKLNGFLTHLQTRICEVDADVKYNAIYVFDATVQAAPPNLPRGYNWHIDMIGPMLEEHQYSRFFYQTLAESKEDDEQKAVAHWVIDGKRMFFEYLEEGNVITVVDITDSDGNILRETFRPITRQEVWFFGEARLDPFPKEDNARSILDINVWGLTVMLGNTFDLDTDDKQIVGAINEVNAKAGTVEVFEAADLIEAQQYSEQNPGVFVFVAD